MIKIPFILGSFVSTTLVATALGLALVTNPAYSAKNTEAKANKRVCKKYRPTGTRIAKKTCMSQRGWDELRKRAQDALKTSTRLGGMQNKENPRHPGGGRN